MLSGTWSCLIALSLAQTDPCKSSETPNNNLPDAWHRQLHALSLSICLEKNPPVSVVCAAEFLLLLRRQDVGCSWEPRALLRTMWSFNCAFLKQVGVPLTLSPQSNCLERRKDSFTKNIPSYTIEFFQLLPDNFYRFLAKGCVAL